MEGDGLGLLGCKGHCTYSLTTFRKAKLSMGNTMPTCWGCCERQSSQNGLKNWRRKYWFTTWDNAPAHKSVLQSWLLCMIVALNWLITLKILLIWQSSIFCSQTWKQKQQQTTKLGWEAVSDWWWGHICSLVLFWGSGWELLIIPKESKRCNTDGRSICGQQGRTNTPFISSQ